MNTAFVEGQRVVFHRNGVVDDPGRPILKLSVMQGIYLEAVSAEELEMTFFHEAAERCILLMELFVPLLQRKVGSQITAPAEYGVLNLACPSGPLRPLVMCRGIEGAQCKGLKEQEEERESVPK